jgi:hypothetical protein
MATSSKCPYKILLAHDTELEKYFQEESLIIEAFTDAELDFFSL